MSFSYTRTITTSGCAMPMMPMMAMRPMMHPAMRMPLFGGYCRPMGCCATYGAILAGACTGMLLANPQTLNGIYNYVLKPIGSGLRWLWDHTLGLAFKSKKKSNNSQTTEA